MTALTAELTERRLRELGELYRFSMSLLEARAPMLTDEQLTRSALQLHAERHPALPCADLERTFRASPSSRQHLVGAEYDCWFFPGVPVAFTRTRAILTGVIDERGARVDWLMAGSAGTVRLQFPQGVPRLPEALFCLGDSTLLRLRKP